MSETSIEWCRWTFNPWLGCAKVHAGCKNCYAETNQGVVMRKGGRVEWGEVWQGGKRVLTSDSYWRQPLSWARKAAKAGERHRVFCGSLCDVLEVPGDPPLSLEDLEPAADRARGARDLLHHARARLWPIIEDTAWVCGSCERPCAHSSDTPHRTARLADLASVGAACEGVVGGCEETYIGGLDWLLLTKRPENAPLVPTWARPLVWLGTSISDQRTAAELVLRLLEAEGFRYRFFSVEPLVGPVDLTRIPGEIGAGLHSYDVLRGRNIHHDDGDQWTQSEKVDWVIVGGESGSKARPCSVEWIRSIVCQCREAGVACFVKQLGERPAWSEDNIPDHLYTAYDTHHGQGPHQWPVVIGCNDKKGGDMAEWPEDLRVRQFPES